MAKRRKITIKPKTSNATASTRSFGFKSFSRTSLIYLGIGVLVLVGLLLWGIWPTETEGNPNETPITDTSIVAIETDKAQALSIYTQLEDTTKYVLLHQDVFSTPTASTTFFTNLDMPASRAQQLARLAIQHDQNQFHQGQMYKVYALTNGTKAIKYVLYQKNNKEDLLFTLFPIPKVDIIEKEKQITFKGGAVVLKSGQTIEEAAIENDIPLSVFYQLDDAMKWTVDLYHLKPGDRFKVLYEELVFEDGYKEPGQLLAVQLQSENTPHVAYHFVGSNTPGFFNENGQTVKQTFLKAPVALARISSKFNLERLHPVTGDVKPHLGTDYAAVEGSDIVAVADGVVTKASFTSGNGNFVKVRHDQTYETQYLHMKNFADGIRPGSKVKQGQVIGYVGQTGLATGPHVCFRFWKNSQQVDHTKEQLSLPGKVDADRQNLFIRARSAYKTALEEISYF